MLHSAYIMLLHIKMFEVIIFVLTAIEILEHDGIYH